MIRVILLLPFVLISCSPFAQALPSSTTLFPPPVLTAGHGSPRSGLQPQSLTRDAASGATLSLSTLRVGWAYEAYPEASAEKMRDDMRRMREQGANAIWLGHNNPGEVDAAKVEPGMSYAVYAALQDENDPLHADARAMADAVTRALEAARAADLRVILPIGYQIQMGQTWNRAHPNDLRVTSDGRVLDLYNSGPTASPYSAQYRADIARYYQWIQRTYVEPYRDVIAMLSLADEPMGGDYSASAKAEFRSRYGREMDSLADSEVWMLGEFQAGLIADYAAWSANEWARINPEILTTMSFHGGDTARRVWGLPEIEKLFSHTPDNFVVAFDAYLHDDLASKPATADERAQLKLFLTTIGHYSRIHNKPVALWGGVNAWGLAQESHAPLDIPDAVTNLLLLNELPARTGGSVWGIFAWNYNVKRQGLENYTRATTYDPRAMEIAVSRTFALLRTSPPARDRGAPEIAIWVPRKTMWERIGESRAAGLPPTWFDASPYARAFANRSAAFVTAVPEVGSNTRYLVVSSAVPLDAVELDLLDTQIANGRIILGPERIVRTLGLPTEQWQAGLTRLPETGGVVYALEDTAAPE